MPSLSKRIVEHVSSLPEGTPICAGALLHLGSRAAVDQALSRFARSGRLMRGLPRDLYDARRNSVWALRAQRRQGDRGTCRPVERDHRPLRRGRGACPWPYGLRSRCGRYISHPAPDRRLRFGSLEVELRHAPRWQLTAPHRRAGDVIRALAWLGPAEIQEGLQTVLPGLSHEDMDELAEARATMPHWMAEPVSALVAHG